MKVLVTGANGFIGKNLCSHLKIVEDIELIPFTSNDDFSKLENEIANADFIFHLAGVNRPKNLSEFYVGNTDLTKAIVDAMVSKKSNAVLVFASSIQAERDNDYGRSKLLSENYIKGTLKKFYIYRLHNVFGKWCKPNYNSVIATFCYNIAHDQDIRITDKKTELTLIYIDDICAEFKNLIFGKKPCDMVEHICFINPRYNISLGYIAEQLYQFKASMESIFVPNTGNEFIKKLYSTYTSYLPFEKQCMTAIKHTDERGSFSELIKSNECGQVSFSVSKPAVIRGNHYHHTKIERFIVIKGKAKISFRHIIDGTRETMFVDERDIKIITIPVGWTHAIENIGDNDMILLIWCNELFDKENPDTYFAAVNNNENE